MHTPHRLTIKRARRPSFAGYFQANPAFANTTVRCARVHMTAPRAMDFACGCPADVQRMYSTQRVDFRPGAHRRTAVASCMRQVLWERAARGAMSRLSPKQATLACMGCRPHGLPPHRCRCRRPSGNGRGGPRVAVQVSRSPREVGTRSSLPRACQPRRAKEGRTQLAPWATQLGGAVDATTDGPLHLPPARPPARFTAPAGAVRDMAWLVT